MSEDLIIPQDRKNIRSMNHNPLESLEGNLAEHNIGVWCPNGWVDLVLELHNDIKKICPNYKITQVKSKFGGLRFYIDQIEDEKIYNQVHDLISATEKKSFTTCETCGKSGQLQNNNDWYETICDEHAKKD